MSSSKKVYLILILGFFLSISYSFYNLSKFDKHDSLKKHHLMIRGDLNLIWKEAETFKKDFFQYDKSYFISGIEYTRTYLPSKIIALYSEITNYELYDDFEQNIISEEGKRLYLLFQTILFYISLLFFYSKLKIFTNNEKISIYIISFLSLEPTILQWHSTFWTESLYFTLQIIFLSILIDTNNVYSKFLKLGIVIGLMFFQKTVSIFLIIPVVLYFLINKFDKKIINIFILISTYLFFIIFLGFNNYKKTGIFYILPSQTKDAHYTYLIPQIFEKKDNFSEYYDYKYSVEKQWKDLNNFDQNNFKDLHKFYKFKQSVAIEEMLENKLIVTKIYLNKILHHFLLNPVQTFYWHEYNKSNYKIQYHLSKDKQKWLIFRFIYSFFIFSIMFLGLIRILNLSIKLKFHCLVLVCIIYYSIMLGWVGNTRYFMPSMIFLSLFFGQGIIAIEKLFNKYLKKNNLFFN